MTVREIGSTEIPSVPDNIVDIRRWGEDFARDHYEDLKKMNEILALFTIEEDYADGFGPISYIDFDTTYEDGTQEGRLQWNSDDGTLEVGMPGGSVNLQIGQEILIRVTNDSGSDIPNGTPVYISGATGSNVTIDLADADFAAGSGVGLRTVGVTTEDIDDNQKGYIVTTGLVRDIDTSSFAAEGVPVYLAVGGGFAASPPTPPATTYVIGVVVRKHATQGAILVIQTSLPYIGSLSDVFLSGLHDLDLLTYSTDTERWENDANPWEDLRVPAQNTKLNPTKSEPNFEEFTDGLFVYKFDTSNADDESIHFVAQMPHAYKEGSDIRPHLHWAPDNTNTGNVVWQFEYIISNISGTFPSSAVSSEITVAADGTALKHQVDSFATIDGTGLTISHMLICRLTRMSGSDANDTFTGNACFLEFDFHYQKDTMGSRNELSK